MYKNYIPFLALIAVIFLFIWVRKNQRGAARPDHIAINAKEPGFDRNAGKLIYSRHARCRMDCRHIDEEEIKEILHNGEINYSKIEVDAKGKTYPLEGTTRDKQHVRIVFAPHADEIVVVTVIDLDTEWQCNCN